MSENPEDPGDLFRPSKHLSDEINNHIIESEIEGGVFVEGLQVGKSLEIQTQSRKYVLKKVGADEFTIEGHPKYCPQPISCKIFGSSWGGSMLKTGFVGRGMLLVYNTIEHPGEINTSMIQDIKEVD